MPDDHMELAALILNHGFTSNEANPPMQRVCLTLKTSKPIALKVEILS